MYLPTFSTHSCFFLLLFLMQKNTNKETKIMIKILIQIKMITTVGESPDAGVTQTDLLSTLRVKNSD